MTSEKLPIRWAGVLVAFALNLLLVSLTVMLVRRAGTGGELGFLPTVVAPLAAGVLAALYTGYRGGIHAFLGGMLSIPFLIFLVFQGVWQFGIFAGAFCTAGGAITEIVTRRS